MRGDWHFQESTCQANETCFTHIQILCAFAGDQSDFTMITTGGRVQAEKHRSLRSHIHILHKESANVPPRMFFLFGSGATRIHIHSLLLAGLLCHEQQAADHIIVIPLISSCTFYVELCGEYACFSNHGTRCCDLAAKTHRGHGG